MYCILTSGRLFESPYGEERYTLSLAKWLSKQKLEVVIIGATFSGVRAEYLPFSEKNENKKDNQKLRALNPPYLIYTMSRWYLSLLFFFKILSINRKTPLKLIHAQDSGYSGIAAVMAGKILKIPVIVSAHIIRHKALDPILEGSRFKKILVRLEYNIDNFTVRNADSVIAINPFIKEYYEKIIGKTIQFIPNPIKTQDFEFSYTDRSLTRKYLGIDEQTKLIGYVGRLSPEKNITTLLDSFARVIEDNPSVRLAILGMGPQESLLKEVVRKHHMEDKVIFRTFIKDIHGFYSSLDIFVLPSFEEGMPTVLLEAMSSGRAIICSNIPGNQVLITHNSEGLVFDPHNSKELADDIHLLLTDDSLRSRLGNNAKIKSSEYNEEVVFFKILHLYSALTKKAM
ncbi:MAG: glycosyltransferase family 4 protein [Nitrososphaeraceae archaeon]